MIFADMAAPPAAATRRPEGPPETRKPKENKHRPPAGPTNPNPRSQNPQPRRLRLPKQATLTPRRAPTSKARRMAAQKVAGLWPLFPNMFIAPEAQPPLQQQGKEPAAKASLSMRLMLVRRSLSGASKTSQACWTSSSSLCPCRVQNSARPARPAAASL